MARRVQFVEPLVQRRTFLKSAGIVLATGAAVCAKPQLPSLADRIGVTMGTFAPQRRADPANKYRLDELAKILRGEIGVDVIDLNTNWIDSFDPKYLEQARSATEKAGCVFTNVKMNGREGNIYATDPQVRAKALTDRKRIIDAAARLGARWVRPELPGRLPGGGIDVSSHRILAEYADRKGVEILIENNGWMSDVPDSVVRSIRMIGRNVAASPDTGNWNDRARTEGLTKTFPLAVTCDFKAKEMSADGGHAAYDLKRCFRIGWDAGFRGPWCLEHHHPDTKQLFRELRLLREMLEKWIAERK